MKYSRVYEETDNIGKHKVIEQENGIKIRLLREPSQWWKDKQAVHAEEMRVKREVQELEIKKKRKIQLKIEIDAGVALGLDMSKEQAELDALMAG